MPKQYPLDWPEGSPRQNDRRHAKFQTSFSKALEGLMREMKLIKASHILLSCNLPPARDGWPDPRASLKGGDPGVAAYWIVQGKTYVLACDTWDRVEHNLQAITLTIAADRGKARWGCNGVVEKSLSAYLALPAPQRWWEVLGVREDTPLDEIRAIYRLRVKQNHPDQAHDDSERRSRTETMSRLNLAMETAEKERSHAH